MTKSILLIACLAATVAAGAWAMPPAALPIGTIPSVKPRPPVQFTSPAKGNEWFHGSLYEIKWTPTGLTGNVKLVLLRNGTLLGTIADNVPLKSGVHKWFCSNFQGGVAPGGEGYQVAMVPATGRVLEPPRAGLPAREPEVIKSGLFGLYWLTVTAPKGGDVWIGGSDQTIVWSASNVPGTINLLLWNNGHLLGYIAKALPVAPSAYSWKAGTYDAGTAPAGGGYFITPESANPKYRGANMGGSFALK